MINNRFAQIGLIVWALLLVACGGGEKPIPSGTVDWRLPEFNEEEFPDDADIVLKIYDSSLKKTCRSKLNAGLQSVKFECDNSDNYVADKPFTYVIEYITKNNIVIARGEGEFRVQNSNTPTIVSPLMKMPLNIPDAPKNLRATEINTTDLTLGWDSVPGATGYTLYWTMILPTVDGSNIQTQKVAATDFTHTGLDEDSVYYYVVSATNAAGEGSASGSFSHPETVLRERTLLSAPTDLTVTTCFERAVLAWSNNGAQRYDINWRTENDLTKTETISDILSPYQHTKLIPDIDYHYQLVAYNNEGTQGPVSNVTLATIRIMPGKCKQVISIGDGVEFNEVEIPAGSFKMGDHTLSGYSQPIHTVTFNEPFTMGEFEVTFEEYDLYLKSQGRLPESNEDEAYDFNWRRIKNPVIWVSRNEIQKYIDWFNIQVGIAMDDPNRYRLPSEAEWEYAARARLDESQAYLPYPWGEMASHDHANYGADECCGLSVPGTLDIYATLAPVGQFPANAFGLFDMHGNVAEWTADCFTSAYGGNSNYNGAPTDGSAWAMQGCSAGMLRGGDWSRGGTGVRSSYRLWRTDFDKREQIIGFRLARSLNSLVPSMVVIPAGSFNMGDETSEDGITPSEGRANEVPVHKVVFNQPFAIGKYEVTFAEYDRYLTAIGRPQGGEGSEAYDRWGRDQRPVTEVSWTDVQGYIAWLNEQLNLTGQMNRYRLPTEAEWEYATRAGTSRQYNWGDTIGNNNANCTECNNKKEEEKTIPVGQFSANLWGLYDTHGNAWEWVQDCYVGHYNDAPDDGAERPELSCVNNPNRVLRGGAWDSHPWDVRAAYRHHDNPDNRDYSYGFRLARSLINEPEMVLIPTGSFDMGDSAGVGDSDEKPVHAVTITQEFALGKYEVTFDEYDKYLTAIGRAKGTANGEEAYDNGWGRNQRPVNNVSWSDVHYYIDWLNKALGLTNHPSRYRLPTEAEWEWATRSRTLLKQSYTQYPWGNEIGVNNANCWEDECGDSVTNLTAPVGEFSANAFGLHDMQGNVWEWVEDCWNDNYTDAPTNGSAWLNGECERRVLRGGSWSSPSIGIRSAIRSVDSVGPNSRRNDLGFRLARTL